MDLKTDKRALRISKIVALNLIPIVGIFVLEWKMYEVAMTYLLQTFVAFFIYDFDKYFIDKETRVGIFFGTIQLLFLAPLLVGFMFCYSVILYLLTAPTSGKGDNMIDRMIYELDSSSYFYMLITLFVFEAIHYALNNRNGRKHKTSSLWFNIRKILLIHFFIIISVIIFGAFQNNTIMPILFLILFKVLLDYVIEDTKFLSKLHTLVLRRK